MRNFYLRLAVSNITKNKPIYFPFLMTNILSVTVFFIMASIENQSIIATLPGSYVFIQFLKAGVIVTGLFAGIFLLYTNDLLIRQRKKELGLYNIFGLEKKHIARILCYESLLVTVIGIFAGIAVGICFGKLFFLILLKLLRLDSGLSFRFSQTAFSQTIIYFTIIGGLVLLYNLLAVAKAKPVELLYAERKGDTYHSLLALKAILGGLCLVGAYGLILTTPNPIDVIGRILPIAVLIILGTFFFFSSGSVFLLQALKKNEHYYYKPQNFVAVSGLIYRLKQNAKGLSNICILSTVIMVAATTTLSLYVGQQEMVSFRFPMETKISVEASTDAKDVLLRGIQDRAVKYGVTMQEYFAYDITYVSGVYKENTFSVFKPDRGDSVNDTCGIYFMTLEDYNCIEGANERLEADEVFVFSSARDLGVSQVCFDRLIYHVKAELSHLAIQNKSVLSSETLCFIICPDRNCIDNILNELSPADGKFKRTYNMMFNVNGGQKTEYIVDLQGFVSGFEGAKFENAELVRQQNMYTYGGFLFIGILLSVLFMIFLTLVIYYKQITEGYSDRYNFQVMQKVGLDREEVSHIVHKEIRMMFFIPLFIAIIHLIVSLYAIIMLLSVFGMTNILVFILCAGIISLLFVVIYMVMYFSTSRVYCKIVLI